MSAEQTDVPTTDWEKRGQVPVTLPLPEPTTSYWQDPPDEDIADLNSTANLPSEADVVIIGSGITGAAVAWNLLDGNDGDQKRTVVMLEARQICSGATGRNGGHTKTATYSSYRHHCKELDRDAADKIARFENRSIDAVHAFAAEHSIACDSRQRDTVDVFLNEKAWTEAQADVAALPSDLAKGYRVENADTARTTYFVGGNDGKVCGTVRYPAGSINAYRFTVGVLKLCLERGLEAYTHAPVTSMVRGDHGKWIVGTDRGTVTAKDVVLATNGYTAALDSRFQGTVVPLRGQVTAQRPGMNMPTEGLDVTYSFIHGDDEFDYMVSRRGKDGGDVIIGGGIAVTEQGGLYETGNTDDTGLNATISEYLRGATPRFFGDHWGENQEGGQVLKEWTGIMGYSADGHPLVGRVPDGDGSVEHQNNDKGALWASCSFQGHGMVLCWMSARALVEMMKGRDNEELAGWFPDVFRITQKRMDEKFKGFEEPEYRT